VGEIGKPTRQEPLVVPAPIREPARKEPSPTIPAPEREPVPA
jgi:hypothetical protein